jgi:DNA-binding transcriptional LysR family regulator
VMDLDDLGSFVEVVESGGFNRAARRLGISKSIVSRRIARLEAELGTRLLSRTTRGISPTEAGLELKTRGERILAELEEAREAVAQQSGGVVGRLRLSAPLSFGVRHVVPVLAEMAQRHPRLEMDVSYSDRLVDLIGERFDAAIRIGPSRTRASWPAGSLRFAPCWSRAPTTSPDAGGHAARTTSPGTIA